MSSWAWTTCSPTPRRRWAIPLGYSPWNEEEEGETSQRIVRIHHDWANMPGTLITADDMALIEPDLLERDDFSLGERQGAWGQAEEIHQESRKNGSPRPGQTGAYMVSGKMGGNKSPWIVTELLEEHLAVMRWSERAGCEWPAAEPYAPLDFDEFIPGNETKVYRVCGEGINIELWLGEGRSHAPGYGDVFTNALIDWLLAQELVP